MLDVIIFIILSPAFVVLFLYLVWRIRLSQQLAADLAPAEVVSNLPIKVFFNSKLKENDPVECVICLEEFEDEAELRVLPCRHEYHVVCIDSWLTKRKKFVSLLYFHCFKFIFVRTFHIIKNTPLKRWLFLFCHQNMQKLVPDLQTGYLHSFGVDPSVGPIWH